MRILVFGANNLLGNAVCAKLSKDYVVCAIDTDWSGGDDGSFERIEGDIRNREFVEKVVKDTDIVVLLNSLYLHEKDEVTALDTATRGIYNVMDLGIQNGVRRFLLASSLSFFNRFHSSWKIGEEWRPRPLSSLQQLIPWLGEISVREATRTALVSSNCLRFGNIYDDATFQSSNDPLRVHIEDAVQGVMCGVAHLVKQETIVWNHWRLFHIVSGGEGSKIRLAGASSKDFGYQPQYQIEAVESPMEPDSYGSEWRRSLEPVSTVASRPIRKVVIFGAGGPVASALVQEIKDTYHLRLSDIRALSDIIADNKPQFPGAPMPVLMDAPHEEMQVDIRDQSQVEAACEGCDAIVNLSVLRHDPVDAFLVNTLGAYNVMRAAVKHGIRRVVHTGPQHLTMDGSVGYWWDYDVPGDSLPRSGRSLYGHSKVLGQEIVRVFAEEYGLEVPTLLYTQFLNPEVEKYLHPMAVTWQDSARALRCALEVPSLPSPYEVVHISSDTPIGRFSAARAKEILGWEYQDPLFHLWTR